MFDTTKLLDFPKAKPPAGKEVGGQDPIASGVRRRRRGLEESDDDADADW